MNRFTNIVQSVTDAVKILPEIREYMLLNVEVIIQLKKFKLAQNTTKQQDIMRINGYKIKLHGQKQRPLAGNVAAVQRNK